VQTERYLRDYNEVKALGCDVCTARSAAQTEIAKFWVESSPLGWNRIAGIVASQRRLDAETASPGCFVHGEFTYASNRVEVFTTAWRPVSAIELPRPTATRAETRRRLAGGRLPDAANPRLPQRARAGGTAAAIIEAVAGVGPLTTSTSLLVTRSFHGRRGGARERRVALWGTIGGPPRLARPGDRSGAMSSPTACAA
jgi:hypothetical protein